MATQIQWRGGTTAEHASFTGAKRELTIDTDKKTVVVHDGGHPGGFALAREDLSNVTRETLLATLSLKTSEAAHFLQDIKKELIHKMASVVSKERDIIALIKEEVLVELSDAQPLQSDCPVGSVFAYTGERVPDGFLLLQGQTIGSNTSEADCASDNYESIFTLLWNNSGDNAFVVSSDKGDSAHADWTAGKTVRLPDGRGRSLIGSGQGGGLSGRALGDTGGEEHHQLTVEEMPSHTHNTESCIFDRRGTHYFAAGGREASAIPYKADMLSPTGGNAPHNNMPPWLALHWMIKY